MPKRVRPTRRAGRVLSRGCWLARANRSKWPCVWEIGHWGGLPCAPGLAPLTCAWWPSRRPPQPTQPAAAHPARPRAVVLAVYGAGGGHRSRPPGRHLRLLPVRRHPVRPSRPPPPPPLALAVDHPHPGHVVSATTISPRGVPSVGRFARRARRRCTSPPPARACAGPPLTAVDLPSVSGGDGVCLPCCCRRWWPSGLGRYRLHCQPSVDADRPASVPHFSRGRPARQRGA